MKTEPINFTAKVFSGMAAGLFVSGLVAFKLLQNYIFIQVITDNYVILGALALGQLGLVIWISLRLEKMTAPNVKLLFFGFSILNGLLLPLIFQFFTQNFIISTFFLLSAAFLAMSVFGHFTKLDLTTWRCVLLMISIGATLDVLLNFLWSYDLFQLITSGIAVIVFAGIIAYDSKKIKKMADTTGFKGAFVLYLDVYYLFLAIVAAVNKRDKKISS